MLGGALGSISWRFPFAVYIVAIPIGLLALAAVPEPVVHRPSGPGSQDGTSVWSIFRGTPILFIIYGLYFFGSLLLYSIVVFVPQLLERFNITSTLSIGLFISTMTAFSGTTAFIYGKIRSHFTYERIIVMAVALWTLAFTIISQAPTSWVIAFGMALFGVSQGLIMPIVMVWVGAFVPSSFRGRFSSYLGTFGFIGQFLSPVVFAPVYVGFGFKGIFITGAVIGLVWLVLLTALVVKAGKTQTDS